MSKPKYPGYEKIPPMIAMSRKLPDGKYYCESWIVNIYSCYKYFIFGNGAYKICAYKNNVAKGLEICYYYGDTWFNNKSEFKRVYLISKSKLFKELFSD